ncbi:AIR synthase related protein [Thermosediminibacter litoriperuensis]|nr:AIR synthase related protein [Thermosediminibacter litoriperuensis]
MPHKNIAPPNRDVALVELQPGIYLAVACDSAGGIGEKERDVVKVPPYITGRFTCRVTLMELLAIGADPLVLTATICSEPSPTGEGLLKGVMDELCASGFNIPITISTEKNIPTCQTGLGVTAVGLVKEGGLRMGRTEPGDGVYCLGVPKVGNEVSLHDPDIADTGAVRRLLSLPEVHDIIPVGSRGIKGEVEHLARVSELSVRWELCPPVNTKKPAGPSTCVVFTASKLPDIKGPSPVFRLGTLF